MQSLNDDNASVRFRYSAPIYIVRGFHHFFTGVKSFVLVIFFSYNFNFIDGDLTFYSLPKPLILGPVISQI